MICERKLKKSSRKSYNLPENLQKFNSRREEEQIFSKVSEEGEVRKDVNSEWCSAKV
jgi:hypothetical protein